MPTTPLTCPELHSLYQQTKRDIALFEKLKEALVQHPEKFDELVGVYRGIRKNWIQLKFNRDEERENAWVQESTGAERMTSKDINSWWGIKTDEDTRKFTWYHPEKEEICGEAFESTSLASDSNGWWSVMRADGTYSWYHPERKQQSKKVFKNIGLGSGTDGWWGVLVDEGFIFYNPETEVQGTEVFKSIRRNNSPSGGLIVKSADQVTKLYNPSTGEYKDLEGAKESQ